MTPSAQVPVEALEVGPRLGTGAQGSIYAVHRAPVDGDGPQATLRRFSPDTWWRMMTPFGRFFPVLLAAVVALLLWGAWGR